MKRAALTALAAILLAATASLASLWLQRLSLPYDENGRFFDTANSVSLDDGAVLVYGLLAALVALPAALALFCAVRAWRN